MSKPAKIHLDFSVFQFYTPKVRNYSIFYNYVPKYTIAV